MNFNTCETGIYLLVLPYTYTPMNYLNTFYLIMALLLCQVPQLQAQQDSTAADSLMLEEIKQQMQEGEEEDEMSPTTVARAGTGRGTSVNLNPDISAIGDFRSLYTSEGPRNWDAYVQGVELNFSSAIDPYAKAEFYPVFEGEGGELHAKIEEAYIQTLSLPLNLQLKAGKFRQSFGRINTVHRHALPVINVPVAYESFFGEALIDQGFSLSWLVPNPIFYQELIVEATRGSEESPLFAYSTGNQPQLLAHLKNFWELSDNSTLELGFSGAMGENEAGLDSRIGGIDLTYKWKPIRYNTYKSFEWQTEFFLSGVEVPGGETVFARGMYSWMQYQLSRRWYVTGMYSYSAQDPLLPSEEIQAASATFGWYATEFQKLEIGPRLSSRNNFNDTVFSTLFRWVFVIGSHGAHQY